MREHLMKAHSMHWIAIGIAAIATFLGWITTGTGQASIALVLFAMAFILCLAALTEAVNRCAIALEKETKRS